MRLRVSTVSGSLYILDSDAMTWSRINKRPITGYDSNGGALAVWPTVAVGQRMEFTAIDPSDADDPTPITTSMVTRAELI